MKNSLEIRVWHAKLRNLAETGLTGLRGLMPNNHEFLK
jgi:hypothetical protein